ncbi:MULTISPECIES: GNAT family N-acetyltransferase [Kribbella]
MVGMFAEASDMWVGSKAELVSMYVRSDQRGQGVGGRLVDAFVEWAKGRGAARMHVTAYSENAAALRLYESRGFAPKSVTLAVDLDPGT